MLPTNLHTLETDGRAEDRPGRLRSAAGSLSVFVTELGRAMATPAGDTRGHVRPFYPGFPQQREHM